MIQRERGEAYTRLLELDQFNEARGIKPGESLDLLLAVTTNPIILFASEESLEAALVYREIIGKRGGKRQRDFQIFTDRNPIKHVTYLDQDPEVIPLVIYDATDPALFERMFADGPRFGQLLMGHVYIPTPDHQSPSVHVIGISNKGLDILSQQKIQPDESLIEEGVLRIVQEGMASRRKEVLAGGDENILTNDDFKAILKSSSVHRIVAHALGPKGTNISQAMIQYIESLGVERKTDLIIHPGGVEPRAYADQALEEVEEGVVPIHMECAVYYDMDPLFRERAGEVVFADHHYMPLDVMQLASKKPIEELAASGVIRIATHPTPRPLISPWENVNPKRAEHIKATSNAEAAQMVLAGEADACITTASSLNQERAQTEGLVSRHVFGSPMMFFTIATPLNQAQLQSYR